MGKKVLPKSEAAWAATPSAKPNGGTTVSKNPRLCRAMFGVFFCRKCPSVSKKSYLCNLEGYEDSMPATRGII